MKKFISDAITRFREADQRTKDRLDAFAAEQRAKGLAERAEHERRVAEQRQEQRENVARHAIFLVTNPLLGDEAIKRIADAIRANSPDGMIYGIMSGTTRPDMAENTEALAAELKTTGHVPEEERVSGYGGGRGLSLIDLARAAERSEHRYQEMGKTVGQIIVTSSLDMPLLEVDIPGSEMRGGDTVLLQGLDGEGNLDYRQIADESSHFGY